MFEEEQGKANDHRGHRPKTYTFTFTDTLFVKAAEMREQGESFDAIVSGKEPS